MRFRFGAIRFRLGAIKFNFLATKFNFFATNSSVSAVACHVLGPKISALTINFFSFKN